MTQADALLALSTNTVGEQLRQRPSAHLSILLSLQVGPLLVTQALLPLLHAANGLRGREGAARVVNICSRMGTQAVFVVC